MMQPLEVVKEVLTLDEAKEFLRVTHDMEDNLINAILIASREQAEHFTRRAFAEARREYVLDKLPDSKFIRLPMPPLNEVESIALTNEKGEVQTLKKESFFVDTSQEPGRIMLGSGDFWSSFRPFPISSVKVTYKSGYASPPEGVKQAIKLLVQHMYDNRSMVSDKNLNKVPFTFEMLLYPYRVW